MPPTLRRSIQLPHATAMVVGIIVGASIFTQPSEITRLVPSAFGVVLVWLVAGVLTLCGALVCAELASVFPHTGGVYIFLKEIFSPVLGFLWGWAMFWSVHSGILAAIAVVLAAGLFACGGWHMVSYSAGETSEPERTVARALVAGTLIVTACYVLLNAGYLYVLPLSDVANSTRVAAEATGRILGPRAGGAI